MKTPYYYMSVSTLIAMIRDVYGWDVTIGPDAHAAKDSANLQEIFVNAWETIRSRYPESGAKMVEAGLLTESHVADFRYRVGILETSHQPRKGIRL